MKFSIALGLVAMVLAESSAVSIGVSSLVPGAPVGVDGRVLDTPEVVAAKAEHAVAHLNERINLVNEAVRSADFPVTFTPVAGVGTFVTTNGVVPFGVDVSHFVRNQVPTVVALDDARVYDNSEVRLARAEQVIAQLAEKVRLVSDNSRVVDGVSSDVQ